MRDITVCPITDIDVTSTIIQGIYNNGIRNFFQYDIIIDGKLQKITIDDDTYKSKISPFIDQNKDILKSLFLNNKFPKPETEKGEQVLQLNDFERFLKEATYPKSYEEKLINLFLKLCEMSIYEGAWIPIMSLVTENRDCYKFYFKNIEQSRFYLDALNDLGYIKFNDNNYRYYVTPLGIIERNKILNEGDNSNRCFVAMSFSEEDKPIFFQAIQPVCEEYGFQAIRVDFLHPQSDNTINDLIVAELKKCKFCIADFTNLKAGVYFEAGYALGRGKKVIYTCSKKSKKDLHFDINHYPILIYETLDELKQLLRNKIEAFILD